MSLILDALRKMEQERKARHQGEADIRPEVLSYRGAPQKPRHMSPAAAVAAAAVTLIAFIGGWLLLKGVAPERNITGTATMVPTLAVEPPASVPTSPVPAQAPPVSVSPPAAPSSPQELPATSLKDPEPQHPPSTEQVTAGITISGIAYQEERSLRRAVINGVLVGEGAEIAGARVMEIRENRVRFSRNGHPFEVIHTSGISHP